MLEYIGVVLYGMVIGVALAAPIGPINVEIVQRALRYGFRNGWMIGLGALTADTIYCTIVVSGFTPIADKPALRVPLFAAGAAMLAYVGVRSIQAALSGRVNEEVDAPKGHRSFVIGFMMAAFNPMSIVYWLSVGAALVAEAVNRHGTIGAPALVGGVFLGLFVWVTSIARIAGVSRRFVRGNGMRWVTGISGVIILGFAAWFALQAIRGVV